MDSFAILCAVTTTMVLDLSAGSTALANSVTMALSATNQTHMDVELDQLTSVTTVRSGDFYGTPSAVKTITMSTAVSALLIAHQA